MLYHHPSETPLAPLRSIILTRMRRHGLAVSVLVLSGLGLTLRLWGLDAHGLSGDEPLSVVFYSRPLDQLSRTLVAEDLHPPLYPVLLHVWMRLFGSAETSVRLPSALIGTLLVPAAFLAARAFWSTDRWANQTGLLAAALVALSPIQLYYSQEARNYILVTALALGSSASLFAALRSGRRRNWWLYALATAGALYTHYNAFLVVAAQIVFMLIAAPYYRRRFRVWALALGGALALFAPWAVAMMQQLLRLAAGDFAPTAIPVETIVRAFIIDLVGRAAGVALGQFLLPAVGLSLLVLGLIALLSASDDGRLTTLYLLLAVFVPLVAMLAVWSQIPNVATRYLVIVTPPFLLLVARGIVLLATASTMQRSLRSLALGARTTGQLLIVLAIAGSVSALPGYYATPRQDYRGLLAMVTALAGPNDAIVHLWPSDHAIQYYYRGPLPYYTLHFPEDPAGAAARLNEIARGRESLWVIYNYDDWNDPARFAQHSLNERSSEPPQEWRFAGLLLTRYRLDPDRPFTAEPQLAHPTAVRFENGVTFLGWDIIREPIRAGMPAQLDLHWRTERSLNGNFTVVVFVRDQDGQVITRVEDHPAPVSYPPIRWRPGLVVHGQLTLRLPAETPPGPYRLELNLYDERTLRELDILGEDGRPAGTRADLGTVRVERAAPPPGPEAVSPGQRLTPPLAFGPADAPALRALGYSVSPTEPLAGDWLDLTLYWQAPARPAADYRAVLQAVDPTGRPVLEASFPPVRALPTSQWQPGDLFAGRQRLRVPIELPGGPLRLQLGLRDPAGRWVAPAWSPGPLVELGTVTVRSREVRREPPPMARQVGADFGGRARLLGYDLDRRDARPGGELRLTLYWQALRPMDRSYKVFNHLVDEADRFVGQHDSEPALGTFRTLLWQPGEVVTDPHVIPIRADAPPGSYALKVGLYDPETGARLPLADGATFVLLERVEVRP